MLELFIPAGEAWDSENECFVMYKEQKLILEHSLVSLSKWEAKWNKAFLGKQNKTLEETLDYVRCMTVNSNVDPSAYFRLTEQDIKKINEYIDAPMTATRIRDTPQPMGARDTVTSELIYYWMIACGIPFECQKWHLNRLMMLIRVCNVKNTPPKKMSKKALMSRNAALNAQRRKRLGSRG